MTDYVVLSSDLHPNYAFYAPLTCAVWRYGGWKALLLLVGDEAAWRAQPRTALALEKARQTGAIVHFTGDFTDYRTATVAQLCRIYACNLIGVGDEDYLLTSDVDMWRLGPWIGGGRDALKRVQLYNGAAYRDQSHPQYPMCYVGAHATTWRNVVGGGSLRESLERGLRALDDARGTWALGEIEERTWDHDERHLGRLLAAHRDALQVIPRDMGAHGQRRIDRSDWRLPGRLDGYADAHLPRPGFGEHWGQVRPVLGCVSEPMLKWADAYREKWIALPDRGAL